jgi:hypothetical protein
LPSSLVLNVQGRAKDQAPVSDWRRPALKRTARMIVLFMAPAAFVIATAPGPFGFFDHASVAIIGCVTLVVAVFAQNPRYTRILAGLLILTVVGVCLGLAARIGMGPGAALGLGGGLVLLGVFFGERAVWSGAGAITLAILTMGVANRSGWLHAADSAQAYDWTSMSVWTRVAAGFVAAASIVASAVASVIAHLHETLREHERLLLAEKRASDRLGRLHWVTASLSRAGTAEEVIEAACRVTSEATVDRSTAALWMREGDGVLYLYGSWGPPSALLDSWRTIPRDANLPCQRVVESGQALWVETEDDYRRVSPELYEKARASGSVTSYCLLPLVLNGVASGVVGFVLSIGHRFDQDERAYYEMLGLHCSHALERATLSEAAVSSRVTSKRS